jgi:hypothetical protein
MGRVVWLRREDDRDGARNDGTLGSWPIALEEGWPAADPEPSPPVAFETLFHRHYPTIRSLMSTYPEPGLGLVVAGPNDLEGTCWFEALADRANPLILGRHSSAEVFFPGDRALSLRHLALVVHAHRGDGPARFRILDLRTAGGFQDEQGRKLEALECQGPLLIRSASLAIMLFPKSAGKVDWPSDPAEAWLRVPDRVYFDARSAGRSRDSLVAEWQAAYPPDLVDPGSITLVPSFPGPVFASRDMAGTDPPRGELLITSEAGRFSLRLGARAIEQGVLLGRYERCDTAGLPVFNHNGFSRVHLLVIDIDGTLYAIDTASKNGTWQGGTPVRAAKLQPGVVLSLACLATVEWRPLH